MDDWIFAIVQAFEWVLLVLLLPMLVVTVAAWRLARKYWPRGYKLPTLHAIICTIAGGIATLFGVETVYRWRVAPIAEWVLPLNAAAVVALAVIVFAAAGYMIALDQQTDVPIQKRRSSDRPGEDA